MYTYNLFCYGHNLSKNPILNNLAWEYDVYFNEKINNIKFKLDFPYHGGKVKGDTYSCVFGTEITDDDNNPSYIDTVKNSNVNDYKNSYDEFLKLVIKGLEDDALLENDTDFTNFVNDFKNFINNNEPCFYIDHQRKHRSL